MALAKLYGFAHEPHPKPLEHIIFSEGTMGQKETRLHTKQDKLV